MQYVMQKGKHKSYVHYGKSMYIYMCMYTIIYIMYIYHKD